MPDRFCSRCGRPDPPHPDCARVAGLEPPRFCDRCGRRMVVQVLPATWRAHCSEHGDVTG